MGKAREGLADVNSIHMVLNNRISHASSDTIASPHTQQSMPPAFIVLRMPISEKLDAPVVIHHLTYVNSSVIVVSVYLPAYAHILYSQI